MRDLILMPVQAREKVNLAQFAEDATVVLEKNITITGNGTQTNPYVVQ